MCEKPRVPQSEEESAARFGPEFLERWKKYTALHPRRKVRRFDGGFEILDELAEDGEI